MHKVVFIAKTDLNKDGRILNELRILQKGFTNIYIDFILLPDKPLVIKLGSNVKVHNVELIFRNNKFLRFFIVFEFTIRALKLLFKLKPSIIHAHDSEIVLPVLIYKFIKGKCITLIYDDHEIPNESQSLEEKVNTFLEVKLMKRAEYVNFANEERMSILKKQHRLNSKCFYLLNLPYFNRNDEEIIKLEVDKLKEIDFLKLKGSKFIIHQGVITFERGSEKLANFCKIMPSDFKILVLGENKKGFEYFLQKHNLDRDLFYFAGSVSYIVLPEFWKRCVASLVMYLPTFINNRLCAPNRFYLSIYLKLPVIVNENNPVLFNFVTKYNCGYFVEEFFTHSDFEKIISYNNDKMFFSFEDILNEQSEKFVSIYKSILRI